MGFGGGGMGWMKREEKGIGGRREGGGGGHGDWRVRVMSWGGGGTYVDVYMYEDEDTGVWGFHGGEGCHSIGVVGSVYIAAGVWSLCIIPVEVGSC